MGMVSLCCVQPWRYSKAIWTCFWLQVVPHEQVGWTRRSLEVPSNFSHSDSMKSYSLENKIHLRHKIEQDQLLSTVKELKINPDKLKSGKSLHGHRHGKSTYPLREKQQHHECNWKLRVVDMQRFSPTTTTTPPKHADTDQKSSLCSGARWLQAESAALEGTSRMWPLPAAGAHRPASLRIQLSSYLRKIKYIWPIIGKQHAPLFCTVTRNLLLKRKVGC